MSCLAMTIFDECWRVSDGGFLGLQGSRHGEAPIEAK